MSKPVKAPTINLIIDGVKVTGALGETILTVAKRNSIRIPTLCYLKDLVENGGCRVCVVEVKGQRNLATSCTTKIAEGMEVLTNSEKVLKSRRATVELLLSNHNKNCLSCGKNLKCGLQKLSEQFGCNEDKYYGETTKSEIDDSSPSIIRDNSKCIVCGRCIEICKKVQATSAIAKINRGFNTYVGCSFNKPLQDSTCVGCGQCVLVCPTGALLENSSINEVMRFINDPNMIVIAQVAPGVRVSLSEEFGAEMGTFDEGKMAASLRRIGFDKVFDVNVGADFTVVEEGEELLHRIKTGKKLPLFSSCCPAWFSYVNKHFPNLADNLSSCKSPNEMLGAIIKNCYSKKLDIKPTNLKVVAVMPCVAKKGEIRGRDDVDAVITTRELARLIKYKNIDFNSIQPEAFDSPLGNYSSAGLIFGASGGVTEAVLRTVAEEIEQKEINEVDFVVTRHGQGIKEISIPTKIGNLKIAVISGLANAETVMNKVAAGEADYHFIEVMACPGGCVNGGGQPFADYYKHDVTDVVAARSSAIYKKDKQSKVRQSHKNEALKEIYKEFFIPNKEYAKKLLHYKHDHE